MRRPVDRCDLCPDSFAACSQGCREIIRQNKNTERLIELLETLVRNGNSGLDNQKLLLARQRMIMTHLEVKGREVPVNLQEKI